MNLILLRVASALTAMAIGAALGWVVGNLVHWPHLGAMSGAALSVALVVLRDAGRGRQLRAWLRGAQDQPAPRDTGFWGELGYRVERSLRQRER